MRQLGKPLMLPGIDDAQKWQKIEEKFRQRQGLTNVIGAIDGTHIPIIPHQMMSGMLMSIGKVGIPLRFSVLLMHMETFAMLVYGGLPGSVHDSQVFRKSQIVKDLINGIPQFPQIVSSLAIQAIQVAYQFSDHCGT
ncbi:hypothetical protein O181_124330 [Austropuccinia psidii MF-1]|uniref:DDE Tnp4 domain-containing protein n=1 Tax=Austropuccinia psidii MF-1 TaxID=1389203 RepID=A0A9Q3Q529_9BASI|nr:hypothetical protein [Austropuccinia psidii MF-1]